MIRNYAKNSTEALITRAGIKVAFGFNPMSTRDWKGERPWTRMGSLGLLRKSLYAVRQKVRQRRKAKGRKKEEITFSAEEAILRDVLARKTRLRAHVHKIDDIATLLKERRIPVTYGPVDAFAYKVELKHESWRNIRHLVESGVEYGLMTDHPVTAARQLFLQTRWFTRAGLSKQQAVEAVELVSRKNAELLGVGKMIGTLEKGKWASFAGWNGDPFDLTSFPLAVYGEGQLLFAEESRGRARRADGV